MDLQCLCSALQVVGCFALVGIAITIALYPYNPWE